MQQLLSILALLACPIMMLLCMRGMFGGSKNKKADPSPSGASQQDMQSLQIQMADLIEQNHLLTREIQSVKAASSLRNDIKL
jgi:hypothetical protein